MRKHVDPIVRSLNEEWDRLAARPVPTGWGGAARTVGEVLAGVGADPDARLGELLRHHAGGDQLAGRVVLQAMLGKLVRLAAEDRRHGVSDYVAECWLRLAGYPLARRPHRVAANLALDTRRGVRAETIRVRWSTWRSWGSAARRSFSTCPACSGRPPG